MSALPPLRLTEHAIDRWQEWAPEPDRDRARRRLTYACHHGQDVEPPRWVREASERNRRSIYRFWHGWVLILEEERRGGLVAITCYLALQGDRWGELVGNVPRRPPRYAGKGRRRNRRRVKA